MKIKNIFKMDKASGSLVPSIVCTAESSLPESLGFGKMKLGGNERWAFQTENSFKVVGSIVWLLFGQQN